MAVARVGGIALVGLCALLILREQKPAWAPFLRVAVTIIAGYFLLSMLGELMTFLTALTDATGALDASSLSLLGKALGIAFLTETAASVCRDSGEGGLAFWVETAGKLEILLLSLPLIRSVLETVTTLLGGTGS